MGESLEVHEYERFTPLKVQRGLGGRYRNVRPGDCIVAFSRKDIFTIKQVMSVCSPACSAAICDYKVLVIKLGRTSRASVALEACTHGGAELLPDRGQAAT